MDPVPDGVSTSKSSKVQRFPVRSGLHLVSRRSAFSCSASSPVLQRTSASTVPRSSPLSA